MDKGSPRALCLWLSPLEVTTKPLEQFFLNFHQISCVLMVFFFLNSSKYNTERRTMLHKIPYYVKENFISDYQGSLGRLENSVEEEYIVGMKRACYNERIYREGMMSRAKSFGSRTQYQNAQQMKMPSCDSLYKLGIGKVNY